MNKLMGTNDLIPITDIRGLTEAGILRPATVSGWRRVYRNRHELGVCEAFFRIGPFICVSPVRYLELVSPEERGS
jgi:hypothetical protein